MIVQYVVLFVETKSPVKQIESTTLLIGAYSTFYRVYMYWVESSHKAHALKHHSWELKAQP